MKNKNGVFAAIRMAAVAHHILTIGTILCVAASVVASLIPPLLLARVIDGLTAGLPLTFWAVLAYFASLALEGVLSSAQESLLVVFGQKMTHALRTEMSHKLTQLPASTLVDQNPGEVAARFSGDVDTVEALFTSGIISMVADVCRIISIMVVIAVKNTGLALILLLVLPLFAVFTRHVQKRMLASQLSNRAAIAKASGHVPETLRCIRTIHNLHKEAYMEEKYGEFLDDSYAAVDKTSFYDAIYSPIILTFNAFTVAVVMLLSAFGNGKIQLFFGMTAGTAAAVISYITQVFTPLESIGMEIQTIQSAAAGVHRINEFLKLPEREMAGTMADTNEMGEGSVETKGEAANTVELKNVTFRYEENDPYILQGLSFSVKEGEQVTLTGRTGAGKSTIFKLLLGLYRPQGGQVFINGQPADSLPDSKRRKIISCVEQNFSMVPGTVHDQITLLDPTITPEQVETAAKLTGLDNVIRSFPEGYDTVCKTGLFSQGQWQLLSIARAVAADPRILLLDEITANLDADTEKTVLSALDRAGNGRTVLSISHRLYESLTAEGKNSSRQIAI